VVIFGASGDLTRRKLVPALYDLAWDGLLHPDTRLIGFARRPWSDEAFRDLMRESTATHARRDLDPGVWDQLADDMGYVAGTFEDGEAYAKLAERLAASPLGARCLFYLATPPTAFETIVENLGKAGLVRPPRSGGGAVGPEPAWSRVIIEKPFGHDRASARELNDFLHGVFHEEQIYRIDHYLGKETVQNLLVFRLGNGIFEPLWNSRYVDHVQITVAESLGVGTRAGFYDGVGVLRDMLQNHMMQLLTLVCMEPPACFNAKAVRDEKVKVLQAIPPFTPEEVAARVVHGQYARGTAAGEPVPGYREEEGVPEDSRTDTYLAAKFTVENWRWSGTPFYLRSGKRLPKRATEISIVFKQPPVSIFGAAGASRPRSNVLSLRVQPEEGISLSFGSKSPGQSLHIDDVRMDFLYSTSFGQDPPEAYERLLLDAILGDSTLFAREDEVDLAWRLIDAVADGWRAADAAPEPYEAGSWGPEAANLLLERDGRAWVRL